MLSGKNRKEGEGGPKTGIRRDVLYGWSLKTSELERESKASGIGPFVNP
jgi:hypothetical protein